MNAFDSTILAFLNGFAQRSYLLDKFIGTVAHNSLLKGGLIIAILWGLWFTRDERGQEQIRKTILVTFLGAFVGLFIVRILVNVLPFRPRPIYNTAVHFLFPHGVTEEALGGHEMSFPSDHAALFIGMAVGIFLISRRLGILVFLYTLLNPVLVRMYLGYHYPTDIIAGGIIGVGSVLVANTPFVRGKIVDRIFGISLEYPRIFYGMFFIVSYQTATLFEDSRKLAGAALKLFRFIS